MPQSVIGPYGIDEDNENDEKRNIDYRLNQEMVHKFDFLEIVEYFFPEGSDYEGGKAESSRDHQETKIVDEPVCDVHLRFVIY